MSAQYQAEKENLHVFERELDELRAQSDYLNGVIQEKEEAVSEFNKMIEESEKAYTRVGLFLTSASRQIGRAPSGSGQ